MIRNNLGYKLLALGTALVIWFYVNEFGSGRENRNGTNPYVSKTLHIPLQTRKVDAEYAVTKAPSRVDLVVKGRRDDVLAVQAEKEDILAYISLRDYKPGTHIVPVVVRLPDEFMGLVERIVSPSRVTVTLEAKIKKEMPIELQFDHAPPEGYIFGDPVILPEKVYVYGVSGSVNAAKKLVLPVRVGDIGESGIIGGFPVVALNGSGKKLENLEVIPEKAHLRLDLLQVPRNRRVFVTPVTAGLPPAPFHVEEIEVQPDTLVVSGSAEKLDGVSTLETEPITLSGRKQTFTQRVHVLTPDGLRLQNSDRVSVTVRIGQNEAAGDASGEAEETHQ